MTARKRRLLLALALACMALLAGCTGSDGSASDQSAAVPASSSASAEGGWGGRLHSRRDVGQRGFLRSCRGFEPVGIVRRGGGRQLGSPGRRPVSVGEMDVLEDDEDVDEDTVDESLDEQYSAFTDADTSLPIIP